MPKTGTPPEVSVVIPCFNQGHYLAEAIESVLRQEKPTFELIVVDDGSKDNTAEVASGYAEVRLLRQPNRGLSAARNRGLAASHGRYVVFLDADDRLLPGALATGVAALESHPKCAFAYGKFQFISARGKVTGQQGRPRIECDHYRRLLEQNVITNPGVVIYRREVFYRVGGFSSTRHLQGCEDYELYLRITRQFPVHCHHELVIDWRKHTESMSRNAYNMLRHILQVHRSQWRFVRSDPALRESYYVGRNFYRRWYGERLVTEVHCMLRRRQWGAVLVRLLTLLRYYRRGLFDLLRRLPESNHVVFPVVANGCVRRALEPGPPVRGSRVITGLQPDHAVLGTRPSSQQAGDNPLAISCRNATDLLTTVIFAGKPLETRVRDAETVVCDIPDELLKEGSWPVYLLK